MVWVTRDTSGSINGVLANQSPGFADEELSDSDPTVLAYLANARPPAVLPQDLMAQFTPADIVKIMAAVASDTSGQMALLWYSMVAQRDPMLVSNARFQAGWAALVTVLGAPRMAAVAAALGVTV